MSTPPTAARFPGSRGELVLTTLTREACPLVRYRTGDITSLDCSPCSCGRTTARLERIAGRTDDRIAIGGVVVFPEQVAEVLSGIEGAEPRFRLVADTEDGLDYLEVVVEVRENIFFDQMRRQRILVDEIRRRLGERLDLDVRVKLAEPATIAAGGGRPRIEDRRRI